ncbi:MAG: DUF4268 domain-containing protein [Fimbriimonadales bacterium]
MIGKIERVALRDVWRHEAYDLTSWLQENLDVVNEVTGLTLGSATREQAAGALSVDLVATDDAEATVIIENQLERSDHDHLGKLITYLSMFGARAAVWIVAEPRPEHVRAVSWLNESSSADFYLLKLEAIRIGSSEPAPLLTRIVGPSAETRAVGVRKQEVAKDAAEDEQLRYQFWGELIQLCASMRLFANKSPSKGPWIGARAYRPEFLFQFWLYTHSTVVQLRIDDKDDASGFNEKAFDYLAERKEQIEAVFGGELEWERLDGKRSCCITKRLKNGGFRDAQASWRSVAQASVDSMRALDTALKPFITQLPF